MQEVKRYQQDESSLKDLPYYKTIVKSFLRKQIISLIEELGRETGEETIVISADVYNGTTSCYCSSYVQKFVQGHFDFQDKFLAYCLNGYTLQKAGTSNSVKRKTPLAPTSKSKKAKLNCCLPPRDKSRNGTTGRRADHIEAESSLLLEVFPESCANDGNSHSENDSSSLNNEVHHSDPENIKEDPLPDNTLQTLTIIKAEPLSDTEADNSQIYDKKQNQGCEHSMTSSLEGMPTYGPIRFVRKFPPKDRTSLSLSEKIQIIQDYEAGEVTQRKLAQKYNISKSAVAEMLRNRLTLKKHYELNANSTRKRFNTNSKFSELNEVVWFWFKTARNNGIQMSGPMIQEKALQLADEMKVKDFKASNGWLHSWKSRYSVTSYRDDPESSQKPKYIFDYSKVEGFSDAGPNAETTDAIMNYGSLPEALPNQQSITQDKFDEAGQDSGNQQLSDHEKVNTKVSQNDTYHLSGGAGNNRQSDGYENIVQNAVKELEEKKEEIDV